MGMQTLDWWCRGSVCQEGGVNNALRNRWSHLSGGVAGWRGVSAWRAGPRVPCGAGGWWGREHRHRVPEERRQRPWHQTRRDAVEQVSPDLENGSNEKRYKAENSLALTTPWRPARPLLLLRASPPLNPVSVRNPYKRHHQVPWHFNERLMSVFVSCRICCSRMKMTTWTLKSLTSGLPASSRRTTSPSRRPASLCTTPRPSSWTTTATTSPATSGAWASSWWVRVCRAAPPSPLSRVLCPPLSAILPGFLKKRATLVPFHVEAGERTVSLP